MAEQRWVGGVAAAAVAAFADMTCETAGAVATQRPRVVRAVRGSVEPLPRRTIVIGFINAV